MNPQIKTLLTAACRKAIEDVIAKELWNAEVSEPQKNTLLLHLRRFSGGPLFFEVKVKENWA
jgi:hypothetical protein